MFAAFKRFLFWVLRELLVTVFAFGSIFGIIAIVANTEAIGIQGSIACVVLFVGIMLWSVFKLFGKLEAEKNDQSKDSER